MEIKYQLELEFLTGKIILSTPSTNFELYTYGTPHIKVKGETTFFNFHKIMDGVENTNPSIIFKYRNNKFFSISGFELTTMNEKWFKYKREKRLSKILNKYNGRRI